MADCAHLATTALTQREGGELLGAPPQADICQDCGPRGEWVTLRRCLTCGRIGCCNSSPGKHAERHARADGHPLVQSFEPGEDWAWCFEHEALFDIAGAEGSPSHS